MKVTTNEKGEKLNPTHYYFYECGICSSFHPAQFAGDCRDDANRFALGDLDEKLGAENWTEIPMSDADYWPICVVNPATERTECAECGHPLKEGDETHYPECSSVNVI